MIYLLRVMRDREDVLPGDEIVCYTINGDMRAAARKAAVLLEEHEAAEVDIEEDTVTDTEDIPRGGIVVLGCITMLNEDGNPKTDVLFACERKSDGSLQWRGKPSIVEVCETRHSVWRDELGAWG